MIMYKPTLILKRLVIQKSGMSVYDEAFHEGVNIIRGKNGGGKTTIVESIFYVLGGDIPKKKKEFSTCDFVYAEFEINQNTFTLKRAIDNEGRPAIEIFEGDFEDGMVSSEAWTRYPNTRSDTKKSYSMILFELLGFPEDKTLDGQNITIHDILRLLFEDQGTSSDKIFLNQSYPEKNIKRQAISDLLLGIDDFELHFLRLQLHEKDREWSSYDGQLKQIYKVLGSANLDVSLISLGTEKNNILSEQKQIEDKITSLYEEDSAKRKKDADKSFAKVKNEISELKQKISIKEQSKKSLLFEVEDSISFIASLDIKIEALSASTEITKSLGSIDFAYCPSCLQILEENEDHKKCCLCKSDVKDDGLSVGYLKMKNEISFQKRESEAIVERKRKRIQDIEADVIDLSQRLKELERQNKNFINTLNPVEAEVKTLLERTGYLQRALQDVLEREKLAAKVTEISEKKAEINEQISRLKDQIAGVESLRENKKNVIYTDLNDLTVSLIKNDPIQELKGVDRISFDFGKDELFAVGKDSPAASTGSYLKNAFFFSLFLLSLKHSSVRYPRFIVMDNLEDKGLQDDRVQQFHQDIIGLSKESKVKHQIIFTARSEVITDDLEKSGMCIGGNFDGNTNNYSLEFSRSPSKNKGTQDE
jgi:tetrahydromethanopterin S-methyltransferase subunit B